MTDANIVCEVCVDSVHGAIAAERGGADRVELCSNLLEGGTTPSAGLILAVQSAISIPVMVMIRPRGGDFCYRPTELETMIHDLDFALQQDVAGFVFGALDINGLMETQAIRQLVRAAGGKSITFHRAFDHTPNPHETLQQLMDLGIDRVLTSGQATTAENGIGLLRELVELAGERIRVMPGAGVRPANVRRILLDTGAREIHFSARQAIESKVCFRRTELPMCSPTPPHDYLRTETSEDLVRQIRGVALGD